MMHFKKINIHFLFNSLITKIQLLLKIFFFQKKKQQHYYIIHNFIYLYLKKKELLFIIHLKLYRIQYYYINNKYTKKRYI